MILPAPRSLAAPTEDSEVAGWAHRLGLPGIADIHTHFLPPRMLRRVWEYFAAPGPLVGREWPIAYQWAEEKLVAHLASMGVRRFRPPRYGHRPGMAADLNDWTLDFAARTPGCLPSMTFYPEPGVDAYVDTAIARGARRSEER